MSGFSRKPQLDVLLGRKPHEVRERGGFEKPRLARCRPLRQAAREGRVADFGEEGGFSGHDRRPRRQPPMRTAGPSESRPPKVRKSLARFDDCG
jgi:hypothetical protein